MGFEQLILRGFINPTQTLEDLSNQNLEALLDTIKLNYKRNKTNHCPYDLKEEAKYGLASEKTRMLRCTVLLSFSGFLERTTRGLIRKILPNRDKANKTFENVREKTKATLLTPEQVSAFFSQIRKSTNQKKEYIFAFMMFQGMRRVSEVRNSLVSDVDFSDNKVIFTISKTGKLIKRRSVHFPDYFMSELKDYLASISNQASPYIFPQTGKPLAPVKASTIDYWFRKNWALCGLNFRPSSLTHCFRATAISLACKEGTLLFSFISLTK